MATTSKIIRSDISEAKVMAIALISELTGENPEKLETLSTDHLFTLLSFLLKCEKEKILKLFRNYDNNKQFDPASLNQLWKLIHKGILETKKREFGTIDNKVFEQIKLMSSSKVEEIMIKGDLLTQDTNKSSLQAKVSLDRVKNLLSLITQKIDQAKSLSPSAKP
jgi:viroplasmin and RNaseH domain-containing protein